jgi:adenosylhomocysteine nucleosidase
VASSTKVAIVAALEREMRPLVKGWRIEHHGHAGRMFEFYASADAVVVCGGMGPEAARRTTEAVIALFRPQLVVSAGFAGALDSRIDVGEIIRPARVVDARDGSVTETQGQGTLVSFASVADALQKSKLARAYNADAVDMESSAVARGAEARGVQFSAIKAISDVSGFRMPPMNDFIAPDGQFRSLRFLLFVTLRPWLWWSVVRLARNSSRAADALARALNGYLRDPETLQNSASQWHPMKRAKI